MSKYCPMIDHDVIYLTCQECEERYCEDTFFCMVVGTRHFSDYNFLSKKLDYLLQNQSKICIVSGGASGADKLAERYAKERGFYFIEFPTKWDIYGKSAGYIRNKEMHKYIAKQEKRGIVAFCFMKNRAAVFDN